MSIPFTRRPPTSNAFSVQRTTQSHSPAAFAARSVGLPNGATRIYAIQATRTAGSLDVQRSGNGTIEIKNVNVLPEFRRKGIASELMKMAVQRAIQSGYSRVISEARPSDNGIHPAALQCFYQKLGFHVIGRSTRGSPIMQRMTGVPQAIVQPKMSSPLVRPVPCRPPLQLNPVVKPFRPARAESSPQPFALMVQRAQNLPAYKQSDTNLCWAAVGRMTHEAITRNPHSTEKAFVKAQGSPNAVAEHKQNREVDIDEIIGSQSKQNLLKGSDSSGPFSKSVFTKELNRNDQPIVLNVDRNHYISVTQTRKNGNDWELQIVDPANGNQRWVKTKSDISGRNITHVKKSPRGWYKLSVAYYTG